MTKANNTTGKKPAAKTVTPKKEVAKKTAAKTPVKKAPVAPKKVAPKKSATKKAAPKVTPKKVTPKKQAPKKATVATEEVAPAKEGFFGKVKGSIVSAASHTKHGVTTAATTVGGGVADGFDKIKAIAPKKMTSKEKTSEIKANDKRYAVIKTEAEVINAKINDVKDDIELLDDSALVRAESKSIRLKLDSLYSEMRILDKEATEIVKRNHKLSK